MHTELLRGLLVAVAYFALATLSLPLAIPPGNAAAVWPAAGLAVASCLLYGRRMCFAVFAAAMLANLMTDVSAPVAFAMGTGNALEALLAASLVRRFTAIGHRFHSSGDVFRFAAVAAASGLVASSFGVAGLQLGGYVGGGDLLRNWWTWWLGDVTGIVLLAPPLLIWSERRHSRLPREKSAEALAAAALLGVCAIAVFGFSDLALAYLILPFIVWLAVRFSQREVSAAVVGVAVIAVVGTVSGRGPLAGGSLNESLLILQVFLSVVALTGLALSSIVDQRGRAGTAVRRTRDALEKIVARRTGELDRTVHALQSDIAERQRIQEQLEAAKKQLDEAQRLTQLGSWEWDIGKDIVVWSSELARIFGMPAVPTDLTLEKYLAFVHPEDRARVAKMIRDALADCRPYAMDHRMLRSDGALRCLRCRGFVISESGRAIRLYGTALDVTQELERERQLRAAEERYRRLVEFSPDAVYVLNGERVAYCNHAGLQILGAARLQQVIGMNLPDVVAPADRPMLRDKLAQWRNDRDGALVETAITQLDGSIIQAEMSATPFPYDHHEARLVIVRDISERKRAEREIQRLAYHDTLTGLANRALFREHLSHAVTQALRQKTMLAVLFVDLDRFKAINDSLGHAAGDTVLKEVALRLQHCLREIDTVARFGGDEFVILIESYETLHDIVAVVTKIQQAMRKPFVHGGRELDLSSSIGISVCPGDTEDPDMLIKYADIAMYRAKREGRNGYRYYSPALTDQSRNRFDLETGLRRAIERRELQLYYQPKVDLRSGRICGAEALLRWRHPVRGLLLPSAFIALAEESGLIESIGMWALRSACMQNRSWRALGLPPMKIAVNLSLPQFARGDLYRDVKQILEDAGLDGEALELEITESMFMADAAPLVESLGGLRALGVTVSVDDFGTGYSSLSYLKRLPVDCIKIDRSFIGDLPDNADDAAINRAVVELVHQLKRKVIAEGVETQRQLQFLRDNGCDQVQGFYISRALPAQQFQELLEKNPLLETA